MNPLHFVLDVSMLAVLIVSSVQDIKHREIKRLMYYLLAGLLIIKLFVLVLSSDIDQVYDCILGFIAVFVPFLFIAVIFGGVGGADTKISSLVAGYTGLVFSIPLILISSLSVCIFYLFKKANKIKVDSIPFIPFLSAGYCFVLIISPLAKFFFNRSL